MTKLTELTEEQIENVIFDARSGDLETLSAIFDQEVDPKIIPHIKDPETGSTMLHMASANGHLEVVQFLLKQLADPETKQSEEDKQNTKTSSYINAANSTGNTALHWAAFNGHLEVVKCLCDHGADPFIKNQYGHDVFYEAGQNEQEKTEDYLLETYGEELDEEFDLREEQQEDDQEQEVEFKEGTEIAKAGEEDAKAVEKLRLEAEKLAVDSN